jgi:hypothetical protein
MIFSSGGAIRYHLAFCDGEKFVSKNVSKRKFYKLKIKCIISKNHLRTIYNNKRRKLNVRIR